MIRLSGVMLLVLWVWTGMHQAVLAQSLGDVNAATWQRWSTPLGTGRALRTRHYEIFTTCTNPQLIARLPDFMEQAFTAYQSVLPTPVNTRYPARIYLFAERQAWERFTRSFAGEQADVLLRIQQGAYCLKDACVVYDIGVTRTLAALAHEGWHQFACRYVQDRLPSWLDEGLAMQFEALAVTPEGQAFNPADNPYRVETMHKLLTHSQWHPLAELLAMSPGEVMTGHQVAPVLSFYSQSYALVRFLAQGRYARDFQRMLGDGAAGRWPLTPAYQQIAVDRNLPKTLEWNRRVGPELFKYYIDPDLDRVDREYRQFCRSWIGPTP